MAKNGLFYNGSGYPDPTAYAALNPIVKEDNEIEKKAHDLIKIVKIIAGWAGFEIIGRIQIKHRKSGREFK